MGKNELIYKKKINRITDVESKLMITRGEEERGLN